MACTRREPQRERAGEVLDQDRDEPLEAAEDGAVDHDRPVLGVVCADVLQVEALGRGVVELDRAALPLAAERVRDVEVDLRPVERAVAGVDRVGLARRSRAPSLSAASARSHIAIVADELLRTRRRASPRTRGRSPRRCPGSSPIRSFTSLGDLRSSHQEAVAVVLRELPHARQARERARRFVAVQRRLLVEAERHLLVAVLLGAE